MCRMAVKKEKGFYVISDEYEFAETSYKNVISFAMGMLATRIIANEIYTLTNYIILQIRVLKERW